MPCRRSLLTTLMACALLAACGGQASPTPSAQSPASSAPPASAAPTAVPTATATYAPLPSPLPSGQAPSGVVTGDASACSGSHDNRTFYEEIAAQVSWDVYCAVLPSGWFVQTGSFSLRDGGRLDITYEGPSAASLTLEEGSVCTSGVSACTPHDQFVGTTAYGDRQGELGTLGSDFVVYVDGGSAPSWSARGGGLDQETFVTLVAALHKVAPGA